MIDVTTATKALPGTERYGEAADWLHTEAELLDSGREREWLEEMISPEIVYRVPLRQTVERARGTGFSDDTYHLDETYGSLATRVARNETAYAWAEDPPSRMRHFVTNIRVHDVEGHTLRVLSNLLIYRTRQDQTRPQLFSGERHDVLRRDDAGRLRLVERTIYLDQTVIGTHNLALFF